MALSSFHSRILLGTWYAQLRIRELWNFVGFRMKFLIEKNPNSTDTNANKTVPRIKISIWKSRLAKTKETSMHNWSHKAGHKVPRIYGCFDLMQRKENTCHNFSMWNKNSSSIFQKQGSLKNFLYFSNSEMLPFSFFSLEVKSANTSCDAISQFGSFLFENYRFRKQASLSVRVKHFPRFWRKQLKFIQDF